MNNPMATQPVIIPTPPLTGNGVMLGSGQYDPGADKKETMEREWEPEFRETFSKSILKIKIRGYFGGKYTKKFIDTYLEFLVLNGMVDNLEYLEYKGAIERGQL